MFYMGSIEFGIMNKGKYRIIMNKAIVKSFSGLVKNKRSALKAFLTNPLKEFEIELINY